MEMNKELLKEIEHLYYDEKMATRNVATALNTTTHIVRNYLNLYSNGARKRSEACLLRTTDDYREKIRITQLGERNTSVKLTADNVLKIRAEYQQLLLITNKSQAQYELAEKYGVKRPTISDIVLRKTWKHI